MKKLALKLLISILLIGVIIWKINFNQIVDTVRLVDFKIVPLVILFIALNYIISSIRWKALLIHSGGEKASVGYLTKLYFIGAFFNNFMPTSIGGDAYNDYKLGSKIGNTSDAFTATFMERFTGVVALTLISLVSLMGILGYNGVLLFLAFWAFVLVSFLVLKKVI